MIFSIAIISDETLVRQDGNEVFFKVKKTTPLRKLMDAYCKRQGVAEKDVVFLFDGSRLKEDQTPEMVGGSSEKALLSDEIVLPASRALLRARAIREIVTSCFVCACKISRML
eukprot:9014726-Pyramimonas_sp.AAC.1